jgi:hypothetical protein
MDDVINKLAEINKLSHEEMARLWRFAPPGHPYFKSGTPECEAFGARWREFGGMNPSLSKKLGWDSSFT